MDSLLKFDKNHIWHPYTNSPNKINNYLITAANGVYLTIEDKHQVIDGMSSWWSVIHGYNNAHINSAITKQLKKFSHVMFGGLTHKSAIILAKKLVDITPDKLTQVFFSDSGSVAIEVAIKMALQYQKEIGKIKKNKLITVYGGYHGDTFAAMSVCDPKQGIQELFNDALAQNFFAAQPNQDGALANLEQLLAENHNNIAAMIIEPIVQGAGGMHIYDADYLVGVRKLCTKYSVLLIVDEIATGFGRTGKLFASEYANISADILCVGKALTGGYLSLAATITTKEISSNINTLMHGPTFMANPLACACANASIDLLLKSDYKKNIAKIEIKLKQELMPLKKAHNVADVRVLGGIGVVEMKDNISIESTQKKLLSSGVWLRPFGKLLYTMPPFIITKEQLKEITKAMKSVVLTV